MRIKDVAALGLCLAVSMAPHVANAQAPSTPEEFARRQYDSGQEFLRSAKYSEALKDFQAVVDSYPGSSVADDAMLAIARYQLDVARDPAAAQVTAEALLKKFPTSDSIPMAYVIAGQAMVARSTAPANVEAALASFERVPRLFPGTEAVAPAVFAAGDTLKRLGRCAEALARFDQVLMEYPRTVWASESRLSSAECLVASGRATDAMSTLQAVISAHANSPQAAKARDWNAILYRLYLRVPAQPAFQFADRTVAGAGGKLRDISAIALGPTGSLFVATKAGVTEMDPKGAVRRSFGNQEVRALFVDAHGSLTTLQKAVMQQEENAGAGAGLITLTAPRDNGQAKVLEDLSAVVVLSTGDRIVADRGARAVYRFDATGKYIGPFATIRANRMAVGPGDLVVMLDRDNKSVVVVDRAGKSLVKILGRGQGYELSNPADVAFDELGHVYVLDRNAVVVFTQDGKLLTSFTPPQNTPGSFRDASALALDQAGRLFIYDEHNERVQVYQ
jgi:TolA-binding protein